MIIWPRDLLRPRRSAINPAPATVAGPAALSGFRQAVASPAAVWSIQYDGIPVGTVAQRLAWRALAAQVEGRATAIVLPVFDVDDLLPLGTATAATAVHGDGAGHDDGAPYVARRVQVTAALPVVRGGTQLDTVTISGTTLQAGQHFSIGYRLYVIKSITSSSGGATEFTFWPPARDAIVAGAELDFDRPVCLVRLVRDDGLDAALDMGVHAATNVGFIEDPT